MDQKLTLRLALQLFWPQYAVNSYSHGVFSIMLDSRLALLMLLTFFQTLKTAYEMQISDVINRENPELCLTLF